MIGILYILLCFLIGWVICTYALPSLNSLTEKDYLMRKIHLSPYLLLLPAWFVTGVLAVVWPTYLIAYLFGNQEEPLYYANLIVMPVAAVIFVVAAYFHYRKVKGLKWSYKCEDKRIVMLEVILLVAVTTLAMILMYRTFIVVDDSLYIGVSVFSDFSPHIGMIRSFSYGNNFPTTYSHYAGVDIKYHFMFQFLVGNLEYLGMQIDHAFNIASIISFVSAFLLLYVLTVKITGKISAGFLACLFFAFRSAKTLFTYLAELPKGTSIIDALAENTSFLSDTPNEDWGLWNLNVYCNQRHLAFGLTAFFLIIILFLPNLYEMFESIKQYKLNKPEHIARDRMKAKANKLTQRIRILFFTKSAWEVKNPLLAITCGMILGSLTFFHGAATIGCLLVLFVMAILSKRRLEYLITAVITVVISYLQTSLFIQESAFGVKYFFGFIAENKTVFGVASYLERLLGILPFVLLAAFCLEKGVGRYLILAFSAPLIFAFTISLTVDVTVNHKYIMMSCILLGIYAAALVTKLFERRDLLLSIVSILLIICLTATGIYDFITVWKKNGTEHSVVLQMDSPLTQWVDENSDSKDIFLTANYAVNQIVFGGAMLYEGWPYFPWSAGYDTDTRTANVKRMYEASTPEELIALVKENGIRFIVVDDNNRQSEDYEVNEDNIISTYECVYTSGEEEGNTLIFDTRKLIYE